MGRLESATACPRHVRFVDLVNQHIDELGELLSLEHGKTVADARG